MKPLFSRFPLIFLAAALALGAAISRADSDSLKNELLSKYPLLNDADIAPFLPEYEAKCKAIDEEASKKIAALPKVEWTDEDAELFWSQIAETADRTSTAPRWKDADSQSGEGLLEAFGTRYMPNAYATYQEARTIAKEREQLLAENFPNGRTSDVTGGGLYDKISQSCMKAVAEMFRRHDELCHFYLLHRAGAVTDGALAELDRKRLQVVLPEIGEPPVGYSRTIAGLSTQERDFAQKYLPETWAGYQRLETAFADGMKNYAEWRRDAILVDAVRSGTLLHPVRDELDGIGGQMDGIMQFVKEKKLLHAVGEATEAQLAKEDRHKGTAIRDFEMTTSLSSSVKFVAEAAEQRLKDERLAEKQRVHNDRVEAIRALAARGKRSARQKALGECDPILKRKAEEAERIARERAEEAKRIARERAEEAKRIARERAEEAERIAREKPLREIIDQMVPIPGKNYRVGKYEVSQAQWEAVMGNNPSRFIGADNPVENVSWDECQEFLEKFNALSEVKKSGLVFRLPMEEEWEYACRAGAKGKYCKLASGTEITKSTLGRVALYDNSDRKTHPVGQKEPNAFGLYDMHGNVWEWTQTADGDGRVHCGGGWDSPARDCESSCRHRISPSFRHYVLGFRLCAEKR